jgi:CDP-glucose 4,6-dehydratase
LAAQPIVRESYSNPRETYETNINGTLNLLEIIRISNYVKSFVNVTTDKVYLNNNWDWGYRENEQLDGYDPYSNSKSCSELITQTYKRSFFHERKIGISTARAGKVIGGGDFSKDRIIPDCVKSIIEKKDIFIRNPNSIRPYQHVLEPLFAYLIIGQEQYLNPYLSDSFNIGPNDENCITTEKLVSIFCSRFDNVIKGINIPNAGPYEAKFLKLDCSKFKRVFSWEPKWEIHKAIDKVVEWTNVYVGDPRNIPLTMDKQISEYIEDLL